MPLPEISSVMVWPTGVLLEAFVRCNQFERVKPPRQPAFKAVDLVISPLAMAHGLGRWSDLSAGAASWRRPAKKLYV